MGKGPSRDRPIAQPDVPVGGLGAEELHRRSFDRGHVAVGDRLPDVQLPQRAELLAHRRPQARVIAHGQRHRPGQRDDQVRSRSSGSKPSVPFSLAAEMIWQASR